MRAAAFLLLFVAASACGDPSAGSPGPARASSGASDGVRSAAEEAAEPGDSPAPADPGTAGGARKGPVRTEPKALTAGESFYPRLILRSNGVILASVVHNLGPRMGATFFESTDGGVSFTEIGKIDDPINDGGLCCGSLFELQRPLGAMPASTLLWTASSGGDSPSQPMSLPVWKSDDGGRTWTFVSKVAVGAVPRRDGGLWEPELSQLDDGTLVCHWSDETDSAHSQKLVEARTTDGVTWRDHRDTVAVSPRGHRPGMPNVRRPPGGPYVMSYEICGVAGDNCTAWLRTSNDGWSWGDPRERGFRPTTVDGKHFRHAPTLTWSPTPGRGRFFMIGQVTHLRNGGVAPENGRILLANTEGGFQHWFAIPKPVPVPDAYDNFCPNYSSTLLPLENGTVGLEIASRWDGNVCRSYFARGPLVDTSDGSEVTGGTSARLVSVQSGLCLDVAGGSTAAGANVQQWTCNGGPAQRWTFSRSGDVVTLRAAVSGMCLTVAGGATTPGTNVEQQPCGGAGQEWKLRAVGLDYYTLVQNGADTCLDVAGGSTAAGGNVAQWTCNDLSPQIWHLKRL